MKIFVLASRVPYPLEKGDKLRIYQQVKELSKQHRVFLCCLNIGKTHPDAPQELAKICDEFAIIQLSKPQILWNLFLNFFLDKPYQVAYFYQRSAAAKVNRLIDRFEPDHIYAQLIRVSEYVKNRHDIPKTIDYMDSFSKGMDRRAKSAPFYSRSLFLSESRRLTRYENLIFEYFEHHTIISKQDRDFIWHEKRKLIAVVPNGIDHVFYHPEKKEKQYEVLFTGNMSYIPNVDSAVYLAEKILPLIQKEMPGTRLLLAGAHPVKKVKALESRSVIVSGWMPDLREAYWKSKVFVAPLRLGSGLQNKLLEAMACGMPCVTSPLANNALGATAGKSILLAGSAEAFADEILRLLRNPGFAETIAENGFRHVINRFDWKKTTLLLEKLMVSTSGN